MFDNLTVIHQEEDSELNFFLYDLEIQMDNNKVVGNNLQDRMVFFNKYIYNLHANGYSLLEAIVEFSKVHDIEYDTAVKLISEDLKTKIYMEAVKNNQIKDKNLPNIGL